MDALAPLTNLSGKHTAYCGVCWFPTFRLWVADEAPDYSRCPLGDYSAQTCPNALAEARMSALLAEVVGAEADAPRQVERDKSRDEPSPPDHSPGDNCAAESGQSARQLRDENIVSQSQPLTDAGPNSPRSHQPHSFDGGDRED